MLVQVAPIADDVILQAGGILAAPRRNLIFDGSWSFSIHSSFFEHDCGGFASCALRAYALRATQCCVLVLYVSMQPRAVTAL